MEHPLIGGAGTIGWVALKALLLYLTAVFGFRLGKRRTLAEMSPFDFVAAIAVGAIVGRVPNSSTTSYLAGAATLLTVLVAHNLVTRLRRFPSVALLLEHRPCILFAEGRVLDGELRRCGLTQSDLYSMLRKNGVDDLDEVRYVVFEHRGEVSIIRDAADDSVLVRDVLERAPTPG